VGGLDHADEGGGAVPVVCWRGGFEGLVTGRWGQGQGPPPTFGFFRMVPLPDEALRLRAAVSNFSIEVRNAPMLVVVATRCCSRKRTTYIRQRFCNAERRIVPASVYHAHG
jgi:hypothetical protein